MELLTNPAFLALLGTIFGGIGLKIVESLLTRSKTQTDLAAQIRAELRVDVQSLRDEIKRLDAELDLWKSKYYQLLETLLEERKPKTVTTKTRKKPLVYEE